MSDWSAYRAAREAEAHGKTVLAALANATPSKAPAVQQSTRWLDLITCSRCDLYCERRGEHGLCPPCLALHNAARAFSDRVGDPYAIPARDEMGAVA
jgi:hypothetical protein